MYSDDAPPEYEAPPIDDAPLPDDVPPPEYEPAYRQPEPRPAAPVASAKKSRAGLFLRVSGPSSAECGMAKKMCAIFEGGLPVILYYTDDARYDFATGLLTESDPELLKGLKKLLGEKNVVVKM